MYVPNRVLDREDLTLVLLDKKREVSKCGKVGHIYLPYELCKQKVVGVILQNDE